MKFSLPAIEKKTISLVPAPRVPVSDELHQSGPAACVIGDFFGGRHDLSPEETSQVAGIVVGDEAVGHVKILAAVVVEILGGDRLDHTFAAIGALGHSNLTSVPLVEAWWGSQHARVLHGPGRLKFDVVPGTTISLLAMHGRCKGLTITGVQWPLEAERLPALVGRGVSNIATDEHIEVTVSEGVVTIFTYAPEPAR